MSPKFLWCVLALAVEVLEVMEVLEVVELWLM
jgi:hypothetical protein